MKKSVLPVGIAALVLATGICIGGYDACPSLAETGDQVQSTRQENTTETEAIAMRMCISDTPVAVEWEDNESVAALRALCAEEPLEIQMHMYGGFEQVGSLGESLPRDDVQTVTQSGDIVLYTGSQLVVFYGSNSWAYTRLGHIVDQSEEDMARLLGNGNVVITISAK